MRIDGPNSGSGTPRPIPTPGAPDPAGTPARMNTGGPEGPDAPHSAESAEAPALDPRVQELKARIQELDPDSPEAAALVADTLIELATSQNPAGLSGKPQLKKEIEESLREQAVDDPALSAIVTQITRRLAES